MRSGELFLSFDPKCIELIVALEQFLAQFERVLQVSWRHTFLTPRGSSGKWSVEDGRKIYFCRLIPMLLCIAPIVNVTRDYVIGRNEPPRATACLDRLAASDTIEL